LAELVGHHRRHFTERVEAPVVGDLKPQILKRDFRSDMGRHVPDEEGDKASAVVEELCGLKIDMGAAALHTRDSPVKFTAEVAAQRIDLCDAGRRLERRHVEILDQFGDVDPLQGATEKPVRLRVGTTDQARFINADDGHRRIHENAVRKGLHLNLSQSTA